MKTYLYDIFNKIKRTSDSLDVKTTLCNKSWRIFNETEEKEVYIFSEDGTLIISVNGKVTMGKWMYIAANKSLLISGNGQNFLVHPVLLNKVLVLLVDGTHQCSFLIDDTETELELYSLNRLFVYIEKYASQQVLQVDSPSLKELAPTDIIENGICYRRVYIDDIPVDFVRVNAGSFTMGHRKTFMDYLDKLDSGWDGADPWPTHEVYVDSFYMSKYKVTQKLFKHILGKIYNMDHKTSFLNPQYPAPISRYEHALEFIQRCNEKLSWGSFRLPTEAEWEYAAREEGRSKTKYAGSNNAREVGNELSYSSLVPVGSFKPNKLGLYEMCSMMAECCSDWLEPYSPYYQSNPQGPSKPSILKGSNHTLKVLRGGGSTINDSVYNRLWTSYPYPHDYLQDEYHMPNMSIRLIFQEGR